MTYLDMCVIGLVAFTFGLAIGRDIQRAETVKMQQREKDDTQFARRMSSLDWMTAPLRGRAACTDGTDKHFC